MIDISNSRRSIILWNSAALVFWVLVVSLYYLYRPSYIWLGTEDEFGENMTSVFYFGAGILLLAASIRQIKGKKSSWLRQALPILLATFFIFVGGEEISWGQRLFGFDTPETIQKHNVQNEVTFHNLTVFGLDSALLNQHTILNLLALLMGVVIPLANRYIGWVRLLLAKLNYPVQPLSLIMWFIFGLLHGQTIAKLDPHWTHTEVKELIFSIGFFLFGIAAFQRVSKSAQDSKPHGPS